MSVLLGPTEIDSKKMAAIKLLALDDDASWERILLTYYAVVLGFHSVNDARDLFGRCWNSMLLLSVTTQMPVIAQVSHKRGAHECYFLKEVVLMRRCDGLGLMSNDFRDHKELGQVIEDWNAAYAAWLLELREHMQAIRQGLRLAA